MRPVSAEALRVVRGSHRMCARATVVNGFPTGVNPVGTEIAILEGDVEHDASADIRATVDITTDGALWPETASDLLAPYGNEIFVERGIVFGSGDQEWVSQGYFRIYSAEQDDAPLGGRVRVGARDRMSGLIDAKLTAPVQFAANSSVKAVFDALVLEVYPSATIEYDFDAVATTFPGSHIAEEDRFDFLDDMVRALGKTWYWDYRGVLVVQDAPNPTEAVFSVNHGRDGVLVEMGRERNREGVFNGVVAVGEAPGGNAPVRAVALDLNPTSPTYWFGAFGKVPRFYNSPFITTAAQAHTAATAMLNRRLGLPYTIDFAAVANPALEVLDPVLVSYSDRAATQLHILEKLTLPLTPDGAMTATTRDQAAIAAAEE